MIAKQNERTIAANAPPNHAEERPAWRAELSLHAWVEAQGEQGSGLYKWGCRLFFSGMISKRIRMC